MVELMIAPGKVANIAVRPEDDPVELAKVFGMTYSLNGKAREALENILRKHIADARGDSYLEMSPMPELREVSEDIENRQ